MRARGEEYLTYPQRALFDLIGIRRQVLETDPYGNFLLTGYDYGTARNWARLGLLYLNDGVWQGRRLLPEGFVKFASTPGTGLEGADLRRNDVGERHRPMELPEGLRTPFAARASRMSSSCRRTISSSSGWGTPRDAAGVADLNRAQSLLIEAVK